MHPTPTTSSGLPFRRAAFGTLTEALDYAAGGETGLNFHSARGELIAVLTYRELRERAVELARGLIRSGLGPGERFLLVADTDPDFMIFFLACQYAGLLPVPVAVPTTLGGRETYVASLRRQLEGSAAAAAMAPASLLPFLREAAEGLPLAMIGAPDDFYRLPGGGAALRPFAPDGPSYLQYSSGSTRFPLGVDIPQRALLSNARAISAHGLEIVAGDRCASWLPLYHDMGLVGFMLVPLLTQMSVDYLATRDFARRPLMWLELITRNGGTLSFSPSFGYDLCARRARDGAPGHLDLRRWRGAGIGGDMIHPRVLSAFAEAFAQNGFDARAFVPSYGMAETTLALSFSPLGAGVLVDCVDRDRLARDGIAVPAPGGDAGRGREFVLCGRPLPEHRVEIRDERGTALADRRLGRVFVHGPSLMAGYYRQPEATAQVLDEHGWLNTGDLGYTVDGTIVITGRSKDLIIVNGRNIWPQDLEWAVEEQLGLRRGDTAAFSFEDEEEQERVVLLVQCRISEPALRQRLSRDVAAVVSAVGGVESRVVLVPPHALPQTSSGKLSRSRAKTNFLSGLYGQEEPGDTVRAAAQPASAG